MKKIINSPLVRLSLGLTMLTLCILLIIDMIGVMPNTRTAELQSRKTTAEALAVQISAAVANKQTNSAEQILRTVVKRNQHIESAAVRLKNNELFISAGDHQKYWSLREGENSTTNQIRVPIYSNEGHWGNMELHYTSTPSLGVLLPNNFITVLLLMAPIGFIAYFIFLKRALRELNPDAVIPDRVRTALDTLSEGLLIIDENGYIVFCNASFARKTGFTAKKLLGKEADSLDWVVDDTTDRELPWHPVLEGKEPPGGIKVNLQTSLDKTYTLVVNTSPITATGNKIKGVLITFDDITDIELKNHELNQTLVKLTKSQEDVNRQNKELQILATRDPLTNVLNRRSLFQSFDILFADARNQNGELCCIMVDVDHFKLVNDKYGHGIGDEVIKLVANFLTEFSRPNDLVGRYGGEEFCVVLPDTNLEQTAKIAERIRLAIFDEHQVGDDTRIKLSASFGISTLTEGAINPAQLVDQSDNALYVAKKRGRNRVIAWPSEHISDGPEVNTTVSEGEMTETHSAETEKSEQGNEAEQQYALHKPSSQASCNSDIPELKKQAPLSIVEKINTTESHDHLLIRDRIGQAIKCSQRQHTQTAVMIINVESLEDINTSLGLAGGDAAMAIVLTRLKHILRDTDSISVDEELLVSVTHFRNNEILLLLTDINDADYVTGIVKRIQSTLNQRMDVEHTDFYINTDIGISLSPMDSTDAETLINNARNAMREAIKIDGNNNFVFYSEEVNRRSVKFIEMDTELHHALESKEFLLHYHPKIDLQSGNILGMEALIRWQHPRHGLIMPYDFIPHAEQTGLISSISHWVIRAACHQIKLWQDAGDSKTSIAINLSAVEFRNTELADSIISTLDDFSIDPARLEIEITESAVIQNLDSAIKSLNTLSQSGISIAIDDFGTGYSPLAYLQKFPVNKVKIDRSFIANFTSSPDDAAIVSAVIAMSHSLGLRVVAEGVETEEQLRYLQDLYCDEIQGYLISKPLCIEEANALLEQSSAIRNMITDYEINYAGMIANFNPEIHAVN